MQLVLLRHCSRIDKKNTKVSDTNGSFSPPFNGVADTIDNSHDTSSWLATFDPPLNSVEANQEMDLAFKRMLHNVPFNDPTKKIIIHSSPYNRCIQTTELLLKHIKQVNARAKCVLRVDQSLSEWLNENFNLNYLPPSDDGYSIISNLNNYLNFDNFQLENSDKSTKEFLKLIKDPTWIYNKFGHCGDYGESLNNFKRRIFDFLINFLQYYNGRQTVEEDKNTIVVIISHGAIISTLLQILLNRPLFNEIPLCTPIYLKQSSERRSLFRLMDYDFNLSSILNINDDKELFKILDSQIDASLLDYENLYKEYNPSDFSHQIIRDVRPSRNRSNTLDTPSHPINTENSQLKQTRSSRQLHLLNPETKQEKIINLDKLHSYFNTSDDSDDSDDEDDDINFTAPSILSRESDNSLQIEESADSSNINKLGIAVPPTTLTTETQNLMKTSPTKTSSTFNTNKPLIDKLINAKNSIIAKTPGNKLIHKFSSSSNTTSTNNGHKKKDSHFEMESLINDDDDSSSVSSNDDDLILSFTSQHIKTTSAYDEKNTNKTKTSLTTTLTNKLKKSSSMVLDGTFSNFYLNPSVSAESTEIRSNTSEDGNNNHVNSNTKLSPIPSNLALSSASSSFLNTIGLKKSKLKFIPTLNIADSNSDSKSNSNTNFTPSSSAKPMEEFKRRRKNSDLMSVNSNSSNKSNKSIKNNISSLKSILFQNNKSDSGDEEVNWFGVGFQKQIV